MGLNQDFHKFAEESRLFQGQVLEALKNMGERVISINNKVNDAHEKFNAHEKDIAAHGKQAANASIGNIASVVGLVLGIGNLVLLFKALSR